MHRIDSYLLSALEAIRAENYDDAKRHILSAIRTRVPNYVPWSDNENEGPPAFNVPCAPIEPWEGR